MTRTPGRPHTVLRHVSAVAGLALLILAALPGPCPGAASVVDVRVPDESVFTQDGELKRFVSEVIGDRLAAVTFTYTTCTTICPVLDAIFQELQGKIADHLGGDTVLVTLSIDPVTDSPPRLKAHAEKLGARPGWFFLTGGKNPITRILKGLDVFTPDIANHPPTVFVIDGRRGVWSRLYGFPSADLVRKALEELRAARGKP